MARGAVPALVPPSAPSCHARARQRLYRAVDHLTFRGALVPLVSSLLKLGTTAISGEGALRHTLLGAAGTSAVQSLLGMVSAGDREHSFGWVSTLAPSTSLAPPPSVARWGISASDADQRRLATIDRWMAERNFVTRDEFDAVRAMAQKAREENDALAARIAALEGKKNV